MVKEGVEIHIREAALFYSPTGRLSMRVVLASV